MFKLRFFPTMDMDGEQPDLTINSYFEVLNIFNRYHLMNKKMGLPDYNLKEYGDI